MIDRFTQGFARRSINDRTAAPTKTKYEGSAKTKNFAACQSKETSSRRQAINNQIRNPD
jgi:hypothetical protein